jgi:hypothetical protein
MGHYIADPNSREAERQLKTDIDQCSRALRIASQRECFERER